MTTLQEDSSKFELTPLLEALHSDVEAPRVRFLEPNTTSANDDEISAVEALEPLDPEPEPATEPETEPEPETAEDTVEAVASTPPVSSSSVPLPANRPRLVVDTCTMEPGEEEEADDDEFTMPALGQLGGDDEDRREEEAMQRSFLGDDEDATKKRVVIKAAPSAPSTPTNTAAGVKPSINLPALNLSSPASPGTPQASGRSSDSGSMTPSSSLMQSFKSRFSIVSRKSQIPGWGAKKGENTSDDSIQLTASDEYFGSHPEGAKGGSGSSQSEASLDRTLSFSSAALSAPPSGPKMQRKNGGAWNTMRKEVQIIGRAALEAKLRDSIDNPDLNVVIKLAHSLIDSKHHSSAAAYAGALLMEWAIYRGFVLSPHEVRLLASAHAEVWLSRGMAAENYNLMRARMLYEQALMSFEHLMDATLWIEYSRVLMYHGEFEKAAGVMKQVNATRPRKLFISPS